jgi:hypothetical protein
LNLPQIDDQTIWEYYGFVDQYEYPSLAKEEQSQSHIDTDEVPGITRKIK